MKIKIWLKDDRLLHWAYMADDAKIGATEDGQQIIEAADVSQFFEGHASLVDGKVVPDADYDPDADRPKPEASPEQQMLAALTLKVAQMEAMKSSDLL